MKRWKILLLRAKKFHARVGNSKTPDCPSLDFMFFFQNITTNFTVYKLEKSFKNSQIGKSKVNGAYQEVE